MPAPQKPTLPIRAAHYIELKMQRVRFMNRLSIGTMLLLPPVFWSWDQKEGEANFVPVTLFLLLVCFSAKKVSDLYEIGKLKKYVRTLLVEGEKQNLSAICDAAEMMKNSLGKEAKDRLKVHLPTLTENDAELLDTQNKEFLCRQLRSSDAEWVLSILGAFSRLGESRAEFRAVSSLALGKHLAAAHPEVQASANECLLRMAERIKSRETDKTLLRPSSSTETGTGLLRSVQDASPEDKAALLRSTKQS